MVELADVDNGAVPHYLPGMNPRLAEATDTYGIPLVGGPIQSSLIQRKADP